MKWLQNIEKQLSTRNKDGIIIVNDSKTPSGKIHVGSLRGVIIHDSIYRYLDNKDYKVKFTYGIDDYDPMDGLPHDASEEMKQHMGKPICNIPAPSGSTASDLANHYIEDFLKIFDELGVEVEIYKLRDIYRSGRFNDAIDIILSNAEEVRKIYLEVSNSKKPSDWYPFQVICEKCGKLGTTIVTNYSNKLVSYECKKDLVSWADGCGYKGKISPFNGNGKLPWKLEWTAKWHEMGVDIEGGGEDHCTKGGARDVANACFRNIFKKQPPVNAPYGFFLINGSKMSSSKGLGFSARGMANFLPSEILRYVMINNQIKRPVEFSVDSNKIIKIFNDYDKILESNRTEILDLTEKNRNILEYQGINFQMLTTYVQIPNLNIELEVEKYLNRKLSNREKESLLARVNSVKYWLLNYATDEDKFTLQEKTPLSMNELTEVQKQFLVNLGQFISQDTKHHLEKNLKDNIYELARTTPISATEAFQAIYKSLLNKSHGPKVWTLLAAVSLGLLEKRFLTIQVNPIVFIKEVGIDDIDIIMSNIKRIKKISDKVYRKDTDNEYIFSKKIYYVNQKDRDEVIFLIISRVTGCNINLEQEIDISEDFWFTKIYTKLMDKIDT